jgi:hypothetical protein
MRESTKTTIYVGLDVQKESIAPLRRGPPARSARPRGQEANPWSTRLVSAATGMAEMATPSITMSSSLFRITLSKPPPRSWAAQRPGN